MTFGTDKNHKVMLWCDQPPVCTVAAYAGCTVTNKINYVRTDVNYV